MASDAVHLLDLLGREYARERSKCRYLAFLVHPDTELRSDHLQLGDTDEHEHWLHRYRKVAIVLKHSDYSLGLRPTLACVGRRFSVIDFHGIIADPYGLLVVVLRIDAEHPTRPDQ
ncbi:hypothetical protein AAW14_31030 [Streptomyces hygroscopicus]|nr:hypothetical protein [Streptomyces hygroscopicus]